MSDEDAKVCVESDDEAPTRDREGSMVELTE